MRQSDTVVWEDARSIHGGNNNRYDNEDEMIGGLYNYVGGHVYIKHAELRIQYGIYSTPQFTLLHGFKHGIEAYGLKHTNSDRGTIR